MSRWPPVLLIHINLWLALYAGAGLSCAARLKWDPSTYVLVREVFPAEYQVTAVTLLLAALLLLLLAHLALAPLCISSPSIARLLYITYAVSMCAMLCIEVSWAAWTGVRVLAWLRSDRAHQIEELKQLREHLQPLLQYLSKFHPLPDRINDIIEEATADAPRNLYVLEGAGSLLVVLQLAGVVCALASARAAGACARRLADTPRPLLTDTDTTNSRSLLMSSAPAPAQGEMLPATPKAKYKNGKLVMM